MRQYNLETKERYNAHVVTVIYTVHYRARALARERAELLCSATLNHFHLKRLPVSASVASLVRHMSGAGRGLN